VAFNEALRVIGEPRIKLLIFRKERISNNALQESTNSGITAELIYIFGHDSLISKGE